MVWVPAIVFVGALREAPPTVRHPACQSSQCASFQPAMSSTSKADPTARICLEGQPGQVYPDRVTIRDRMGTMHRRFQFRRVTENLR